MNFAPQVPLARRLPVVKKGWELFDALLRKSMDIGLDRHPKNLEREVQRRALEQTVDYIEERMARVGSVPDRFSLVRRSLEAVKVSGLHLEFGVFKGESINYLAGLTKERIYGFDSFEGLPEFWRDGLDRSHFKVDQLPKVAPNVQLIKGWFNETLPGFLAQHPDKVAFLHVDCDLYSSTKTIFDLLDTRLVSGTIILFDEYFNYPGWREGEFKAFHEFCSAGQRQYQYLGYCRYGEQVAVRIL